MIDYIEEIKKKFELVPIDIGEYAIQKVGPMKFKISCYDIPNIGRVSLLDGTAMFGLMKMKTLMVTSFYKDVPLFNIDRIHVMKNDTLIAELYQTCKEKENYPTLAAIKEKSLQYPEYESKPAWYDSIRLDESIHVKGKKLSSAVDELEKEYLQNFLDVLNGAKDISPEEKKPLQKTYVDGLLSHGGASTDQFVKAIGKEKTEELYHTYLFATK